MNAPTNQSEGTSRKSIQSRNPNSLFPKKNMSIDYDFITPDEFGIFRDSNGQMAMQELWMEGFYKYPERT